MSKRIHFENNSSVRHTLSLTNVNFIAYNEWKASAKRERKVENHFLLWSWTGWEKDGVPLSFEIECQNNAGYPVNIPPINSRKTGYFSSKCHAIFAGQPPEGEAISSISSMRMNYEFKGKPYNLVTGKNWITYSIALVVLVVVLVVVFGI